LSLFSSSFSSSDSEEEEEEAEDEDGDSSDSDSDDETLFFFLEFFEDFLDFLLESFLLDSFFKI